MALDKVGRVLITGASGALGKVLTAHLRGKVGALRLAGFKAAPPPHATVAPPARESTSAQAAKNVVVVTLDGFRHQEFFAGADETLIDEKSGGVQDTDRLRSRYWRDTAEERRKALLPFFWSKIATQGQIFGDRARRAPASLTNGLKFSYPGYSEMFCGFADPRVNSNDKVPNPNPSVLEFLNERPAFKGRVAAYCTWDVFPSIFRTQQNGLPVLAGWSPMRDEPLSERQRALNVMIAQLPHYWEGNAFDAVTIEGAKEHLRRHKPRVLYIALGETDEWAHERRYDLYLDAAHAADRFVEGLWKTLQEMPEYRGSTALLATTDHGRGGTTRDWTSHGRSVDGAEFIWIAAIGSGVPAMGVREDVIATQSQVASTIAALVGEDFQAATPKAALPLPLARGTREPVGSH